MGERDYVNMFAFIGARVPLSEKAMLRVVGVRTTVWLMPSPTPSGSTRSAPPEHSNVNDRTEINWPEVACPIICQRDEARASLTGGDRFPHTQGSACVFTTMRNARVQRAARLKTRHQNLPLRDRTPEFDVRGQFPHAETRSFWTKRRHNAAFRARRDSVCVRD